MHTKRRFKEMTMANHLEGVCVRKERNDIAS